MKGMKHCGGYMRSSSLSARHCSLNTVASISWVRSYLLQKLGKGPILGCKLEPTSLLAEH